MPEQNQPKRLTEIPKCLPVLFIIGIIAVLYSIYIFWHCVPLLQLHQPVNLRDQEKVSRGTANLIVFLMISSSLLVICYIRSICTDPGQIPDTKEWIYYEERARQEQGPQQGVFETKRTGERRHCKWCNKYKPDRCHHCRVCRTCILKMDHHCPWIYNCVGFRNQKFFFQLLLYTFLCTQFIAWTMFGSMKAALDEDQDFYNMFALLFGETLCGFLGILATAFFGFHIWLMSKAMSTIEFCEKSIKKTGYNHSVYDRGLCGNFTEVLGTNPFTWVLPIASYQGDGLSFAHAPHEGSLLAADMQQPAEEGAGVMDEDVIAPPPGTGILHQRT